MIRNISGIVMIFAALTVLIVAWVGIRLIIVERNTEPSYMMTAGQGFIRQEWGYCARFDNETNPAKMTKIAITLNQLNNSLFRLSRPILWLENTVLGKRIEKGDLNYDEYLRRVREIRNKDWDYVISSHPDGRELYVVKNNSIVQKVD
jgi:hypothetical protein